MKNFTLLIISLITINQTFGQEQATISSENMEALIANKMSLFGDITQEYQRAQFFVPKSQKISPIYAGNLWITGTNEDSTIILSSSETFQGYLDNNKSFWTNGPISNDTSTAFKNTYTRVWEISQLQIENHKSSYDDLLYLMPEVIKNWPANGNLNKAEAKTLAPYADVNKNDIYDPHNGDYPIIVGDNAILSIFNDSENQHGFGIEVYRMVYTYNTDEADNIFVNYTVKNRSENTYRNVRLSTWNDFDLGNPYDDYVASVPSKNAILGYNGDNNDEDFDDYVGYGDNPPAFGTMFLNATSASSLYYYYQSTVSSEPKTATDFYNYANAYWLNGTPMYYGGNGVSAPIGTADSNLRANHMFPGHPADTTVTTWNEVNAGNIPSDRRMLMSTEGYSLKPNGTLCLDLAYCYGRYNGASPYPYAGYDALLSVFDSTQLFYDDQVSICGNFNTIDTLAIKASDYFLCLNGEVDFTVEGFNFSTEVIKWVFPGGTPSTYTGLSASNISYDSPGFYDVLCTIHFINGDSVVLNRPKLIQVKEQTTAPLVEGIAMEYNDFCSLNGVELYPINASNYGQNALFEYSTSKLGVFASSYNGYAYTNANLSTGDTIILKITSTDDCLLTQTASVSTIVTLQQPELTVIQHPSNLLEVTAPTSGATYQWYFIYPNNNIIAIPNQTNRTYQPTANGRYYVEVNYGEGCVLESEIFEVTTVGIHESTLKYSLSISPNPSNGQNITVHNATASQEMLSITIFNSIGKAVFTTTHQATNRFELNTSNLPSGQYLIHFESEKGRTIKPLIIL